MLVQALSKLRTTGVQLVIQYYAWTYNSEPKNDAEMWLTGQGFSRPRVSVA